MLAAASTSNLEQADDGQEDLDLLDSEFGRAVSRLRLLDTSAVALELVHTLSPLCRSLPLILLHRSTISATLLRLLPLATGPYPLDLVTALADTGSDLVLPHFVSFLDTLIDVAFAATDAQIASKALNAIAHLFRTLGGSLVQDETLSQTAWITVAAALSGVDSLALHPKPSDSDLEDPNDPSTDTETENDHVATQLQGLSHSSMDVDPVKQVSDPLLADVDQDQVDEKEEAEHHEPDVNQKPKRARRGPGSAQLRHLLASAYAYFVRKCANTPATLQLLIAEMCSTLSSLQDNLTLSQSIAWLIVEASKSTSTGLHSRFPTILKAFATALASRSIIIEKALVGLIHHLGPSRPGSETGDNERETLCNAVFALFQADSSSHLSLFRTLVGTNKSRGIPEKARPQWFKLAATAGCQAKSQPQLFAQLASWSLIRAGVSDLGHAHQSGQSILDAFFQLPVSIPLVWTHQLRFH